MGTGEVNAGGNPTMGYHLIQKGAEIFLDASCYRNRDIRPGGGGGEGALSWYADLFVVLIIGRCCGRGVQDS